MFPFWTKQFGKGDALGIQLLPLGRLLTGCRKEGGNWVTVLNLIEEAANAWDVNVEIWALPQK